MKNRFFAFLLVAAIATFTGRTALASSVGLPAIQINGAPLDASALNCAAAGSQTVCRGTDFVGSGFELNSWEFLFDPDPSITGSFTLTNLSSITQGFSVSATLAILPVSGPLSISGSVGAGTLTDVNGGGATLTDSGSAIYTTLIDGASVHTLLDPPQLFTIAPSATGGPGPPLTINKVSFGPNILAQSANSSITSAFEFTLTAGDSVSFPFEFDVTPATTVPEPGSVILVGCGLACLGIFRRRRPA